MYWGNSNHALNTAYNGRVLLVRETLEVENNLRKAQRKYLARPRSGIRKLYGGRFAEALCDMPDFLTDVYAHIADPHTKRNLRIAGGQQLIDDGELAAGSWVPRQTVKVNVKRNEWAKIKKGAVSMPRTVFDLGITSSLAGYRITKLLKQAMVAPISVEGHEFEFCATPSFETLTSVFGKLITPPSKSYFVYFSDDACWAYADKGGHVHRYNVDISKCDISHTGALFDELLALTPPEGKENMTRLIEQLRSGVTVQSPEDKAIKFKLRPATGEPMLLSGSTLTTLVNNLANVLIGECLNRCADQGALGEKDLIAAVAQAGYVITLERCDNIEQVQFLKHSPIMTDTGDYAPCINYGVALRASGFCNGDLPGRGDFNTRARKFQHELLQGMFPYCTSGFIEAMKGATHGHQSLGARADAQIAKLTQSKHADYTERPTTTFLDESHARRYGVTCAAMDSFVEICARMGPGDTVDHPVGRAILALDYGVVFDNAV